MDDSDTGIFKLFWYDVLHGYKHWSHLAEA